MKTRLAPRYTFQRLVLVTALLTMSFQAASAVEDWKGKGYSQKFQISGAAGMTLMAGQVGFGIGGSAAMQILSKGFFPDMNNQTYVEFQWVATFLNGGNVGFQVHPHLRWDFHRDEYWTFFAIGGFGVDIPPTAILGSVTSVHPRFGIGAFWHLFPSLSFRVDLSHEFSSLGIAFMF